MIIILVDYITDHVLVYSGIFADNEEIEEENDQEGVEEENGQEEVEEDEKQEDGHDQHHDYRKEIRQAIYDYLDELDRARLRGHDYVH